jgi:hypothetical protein
MLLLRCRCVVTSGEVIQLKAAAGGTFSISELKQAVKEHKPAILFLVQVSGSGTRHPGWGEPRLATVIE